MIDIDSVMNDVRHAVEAALEGRMYEGIDVVEDIAAKVRALVVPVFNDQIAEIMEYEERIAEIEKLTERVEELKEEVLDREYEDERQRVIKLFNSCGRKVVES